MYLYCAADSSIGGKSRRLKVLAVAAESASSTARESIFDVMLTSPRPIVSILVLWTDTARRYFASILRRLLQEGFQVVGLKLHMTLTDVKNTLGPNVCTSS